VAIWDSNPVTPGHVLVVSQRHVSLMHDLTPEELHALPLAVLEVKTRLATANLQKVYEELALHLEGTESMPYIQRAQTLLDSLSQRPPDAFNDGINDGTAAGQSVPHLHWHVMPRWQGDTADPRGGIRRMFAGLGNYQVKRP
jgi:ATP adenylyltransferase